MAMQRLSMITSPQRWPLRWVALCALVTPLSMAQPLLPSLGDEQGMPIATERRLGDSIAQSIYRDPDYIDDPVLGDYLQLLWAPLFKAAQARGDIGPELAERFAWELVISRDKRINAFALPGGYMGVKSPASWRTNSATCLSATLRA